MICCRTIFKTFNFYIPFLQLIELSAKPQKYKSLEICKKLNVIVYSSELTNAMMKVVADTQ